ncbi:polysaccharide pyruvyl transferase family protein [Microbacterium keratanolyticum]
MLALRRLGVPAVQDKLGKALLRGSWPTPYVPDEEIAGELPVIANAIGASSLEVLPAADQRAVIRTLRRSPYVSVRDRRGQQLLQDRGVDARLTPDSIAILSRIAPRDIFDSANDTLVVQASRAWLRGEIDGLARSIAEMSGNYASVRLLPIGLAGGHGDSQGLRKLEAALRAQGVSAVEFVEVGSVWDVARAIAGARLFVGTSLHGAITSMAFAVPFVPMSGVSKLSAYVDTWAGPIAARPATAAGLPDAAAEALRVSRRAREELAAELDALAWDNSLRVIAEAGVK